MDTSNGGTSAGALRTSPLTIRTKPRAPADDDSTAAAEEPVSPTAVLMEDIYIVITIGLRSPLNLPVFSAGLASQLARYQRFQSIQVTDGSKDGNRRWARVEVNVDDHIILPKVDPAAVEADPDQAVEDYVASLYTLPMDFSRPPWEFHLLDFPTSEAACTAAIRVHHSLGDGASLMTLLFTSARSTADPTRLPAMPKQPKRTRPIYLPRPRSAGGPLAFLRWVWSYFVLAWNTMVDVTMFAATIMFLRDPKTVFKRSGDMGCCTRRRFVHVSLSLDDVKFIKNAVNCTINDVLVGATSAALSRYYFRKSGNTNTKKICLRSVLQVNLRANSSLQKYVNMIESGKSADVAWGNQIGQIILPFHVAMHDDPLAYVHKAKKTLDRKKSSLEVVFTSKIGEIFLKMFGIKAGAFIIGRMFANTTMSFSNVIGPAEPIELCGHPVIFIAPSVYGVPQALIVLYMSYCNTIKVTLCIDDEIFPDYRQLLDDFATSFGDIKGAASRLKVH